MFKKSSNFHSERSLRSEGSLEIGRRDSSKDLRHALSLAEGITIDEKKLNKELWDKFLGANILRD